MKFVIFLFLILSTLCVAQDNYTVIFKKETPLLLKKIDGKKFKDSLSVLKELKALRFYDVSKGYLLANIDSVFWEDKIAVVDYYLGDKFDKATINISPENMKFVEKAPNVSEKLIQNLSFRPTEIKKILSNILKYAENNGYPFAKVGLENSQLIETNFETTLKLDAGPLVEIIEIIVKGDSSVAEKYLTNYIDIKVGDAYNETKLKDISARIKQLTFISEIKPHEILFTPEGAKVYLYIKGNPVSLVNGIIGLQQDPTTFKSSLTGELKLKLQNVIKRGEKLALNWRSIQPETQQLQVELNYPFLFNTPFGLDFKFDLYKRDSTFLTTKTKIGTQYFLRGGNYLKAFYEANNSSLLSGADNSSQTNLSNVKINNYGLGLYRRRLDYLPNPSKGFIVDLEGRVGGRTSRHPDSIVALKSTTYRVDLSVDWFLPLSKRHILHLYNKTGTYLADEIFSNEVDRLGGLNSQRGFNEEELFATTYSLTRLEYRFLVDQNSHAFAFYDQTLYENTSTKYYQDKPFGFGLGFSFGTNIGIFSLSYALGKQFDNPILLREGKVHFGYIAYF